MVYLELSMVVFLFEKVWSETKLNEFFDVGCVDADPILLTFTSLKIQLWSFFFNN